MFVRPFVIELCAHDSAWSALATRETERLRAALGAVLLDLHHIGSTAIPGIRAKPIVDLIAVVRGLAEIDASRASVEALGYVWHGEFGIAERRYCVLVDSATGSPVVHLHAFEAGSAQITRHLAFRDYLRANAGEARAYETEKLRAQALHPEDRSAYNNAKSAWIQACDRRALGEREG